MKSIKDNIMGEINIKNSRFITYLYRVNSIEEIDDYLGFIRNKHKDSTHCCYAYILNGLNKASDDGEPSNTAGLPILQVLKNKDLNYILAIVVRYFGGIKLGAGGLVRAYTKSITSTLELTSIINLIEGYNLDIIFDYSNIKNIDYIFKDYTINSKVFGDKIIYNLDIDLIKYDSIKELDYIQIDNIKSKYIEK